MPVFDDSYEAYAYYLGAQQSLGVVPTGSSSGHAGGDDCGNLVTLHVRFREGAVDAIGYEAEGCPTLLAACSAAVELVHGQPLNVAASLNADLLDSMIGPVSADRRHAILLVEDAYHRALGAAVASSPDAPVLREELRVVAMSGGVDSSVALQITRERGHETVGLTLELYTDVGEHSGSCCSASAVRLARRMCHAAGAPHLTLDLRPEFLRGVITPYLEEHRRGLTPNPCVRCNGDVRIDAMIDLASRLGAARLVTGHYAKIVDDGDGPLLAAARHGDKDQAYMLSRLRPTSLGRLEFPLGDLTKDETRQIARDHAIPVAETPDSQDLCFLAGTTKNDFLERHGIVPSPGPIVNRAGDVLGEHAGAVRFTPGQRKGVGVSGNGQPLYVLEVHPAENTVVVGPREELKGIALRLRNVVLWRDAGRVDQVRLRYHARPVSVSLPHALAGRHRELVGTLAEPCDALVPGQVACLLSDGRVVGSAYIAR